PDGRRPPSKCRNAPTGDTPLRERWESRMGWNVVVLLKPILDPELPARKFRVAADGRRPERGDAPVVINPFDQNALELALQLKDKGAAATVTAISAGGAEAVDGLRKALALKADRAV